MRRHDAIVERTVDVDGSCDKCGHTYTARVAALGRGQALSFVGLDRNAARNEAAATAEAEARHQAHVTMSLVPCTKCGHRSAAAIGQFVFESSIPVLVTAGIAVGAAVLALGWWVVALFAVVSVGLVWSSCRRFANVRAGVLSVTPRAQLPAAVATIKVAAPPRAPTQPEPLPESPDGGPRVLR